MISNSLHLYFKSIVFQPITLVSTTDTQLSLAETFHGGHSMITLGLEAMFAPYNKKDTGVRIISHPWDSTTKTCFLQDQRESTYYIIGI